MSFMTLLLLTPLVIWLVSQHITSNSPSRIRPRCCRGLDPWVQWRAPPPPHTWGGGEVAKHHCTLCIAYLILNTLQCTFRTAQCTMPTPNSKLTWQPPARRLHTRVWGWRSSRPWGGAERRQRYTRRSRWNTRHTKPKQNYTALHWSALICTALPCTALYCSLVQCTTQCFTIMQCTVLHWNIK